MSVRPRTLAGVRDAPRETPRTTAHGTRSHKGHRDRRPIHEDNCRKRGARGWGNAMSAMDSFFGKRVSRREAIRQVAAASVAVIALTALPASPSYAATAAGPLAGVAAQGSGVTIALASEPN